MAEWLVVVEENTLGPMSARELKAMAITGKIAVDSPVSKMGTNVWGVAGNLKGLFPKPVQPNGIESQLTPVAEAAPAPNLKTATNDQECPPPSAEPAPNLVSPPQMPQPAVGQQAISQTAAPTVKASVDAAKTPGFFAQAKSLAIRLTLLGGTLVLLVALAIGGIVKSGYLSLPGVDPDSATPNSTANNQSEENFHRTSRQSSSDEFRHSFVDPGQSRTPSHHETMYDDLKKEREQLEEENRKLKKQRDELKDESDKLQKEIEHLTSMVSSLKQWQQTQIVMINPSRVAVGLTVDPAGNLVVAQEATGDFTPLAIQAAFNSGRMFIPSDPQLTREVSSQFDPGDTLTGKIEDRVRRYFRRHAPIPEEFRTNQNNDHWVTFVDQTSGRQHLGLNPVVAGNHLRFVPVSGIKTSVDRDAILPGSAIRGPMDRVLPYLDESHFIDQCLLRTALEMASTDEPDVHCVSIQVSVDLPDRTLSSTFRPASDTPVSPYSPILIQGLDVFLRHLAKSQRQILLDQERAQVRSLEDSVNYLEDELFTKLSRLNVTALDRGMLRHLAEARGVDLSKSPNADDDRRLLTTHALHVTVKPPLHVGRYHLAVRLYDVRNQRLVFADNADRVDESITDKLALATDGNYRNYFHDSGKIAALKVRHSESLSYQPLESPIVVERPPRGNRSDSGSDLVYIESPDGSDPIRYRSLFSSQCHSIPLKDVESVNHDLGADDVPRHDLFRYMVCRIARQCLPSAGRVTRIDGNKLAVSIGREGGVKSGQTMRLLRQFERTQMSKEQQFHSDEHERLLNVRLTVTNVFEHHCEVLVEPSGFESDWPEDYVLRDGDIVIPARREYISVGILPPAYKDPDNSSLIANLVRLRRLSPELLVSEARQLSSDLSNELQDALSALNIAVRSSPETYRAPAYRFGTNQSPSRGFGRRPSTAMVPLSGSQQAGVTHTVRGSIQPLSRTLHRIALGVAPSNSGVPLNLLSDGFDFTMSDSQIPK